MRLAEVHGVVGGKEEDAVRIRLCRGHFPVEHGEGSLRDGLGARDERDHVVSLDVQCARAARQRYVGVFDFGDYGVPLEVENAEGVVRGIVDLRGGDAAEKRQGQRQAKRN